MATRRILCVDDDPDIRRLVQAILRARGYEVETASNGVEALRIIARQEFDLIICDLMMPEKDGYDVAVELRRTERTKHIPLIIATARQARLTEQTAKLYDATYIPKPFQIEDLRATVERLLASASPSN